MLVKNWKSLLLIPLLFLILFVLYYKDIPSLGFDIPGLSLGRGNENPLPSGGQTARDRRPGIQTSRTEAGRFPERFGTPEQIILLGIDAADWHVIDPMIREGKLENFAFLKQNGAWGVLESIKPMVSPPLWTTIITGKDRDKHGIGDFQQTNAKTGKKFFQVYSYNRKCPALWNILTSKGLSSCIVNWWTTWPAETTEGCMVSSQFILSYAARGNIAERMTSPDSLFEEIRGMVVRLDAPEEQEKITRLFQGMAGAEKHYRNDETVARITLHLLETRRPTLCAAYLWEVDHLKHIRWLKDMAEPDALIRLYYEYLDGVVGRFLSRMKGHTTLVIVSDHGFSRARHREEGIIILFGAGIREGAVIQDAVLRDVTPTLLALLRLPVGRDMDGKVLMDCLAPGYAEQHPVRFVDTYDNVYKPAKPGKSAAAAKDLADKLKSMGYIQ